MSKIKVGYPNGGAFYSIASSWKAVLPSDTLYSSDDAQADIGLGHHCIMRNVKHAFWFNHMTHKRMLAPKGHSLILNSEYHQAVYDSHAPLVHNSPDWSIKLRSSDNGSVVWLGRLDDEMLRTFMEFMMYCKQHSIEPTVISTKDPILPWCKWVPNVSYTDLFDLLAQHEFCVCAGRSLLDAGMAGLKIVPAGRVKGMEITEANVEQHVNTNFNHIWTSSTRSFGEMFESAVPIREILADTLTPKRLLGELYTATGGLVGRS